MATERLHLKKLINTRDLGGFETKDGKRIKYGKLFRSSRVVKLPKSTVAALKALGISIIVDFRTERERDDRPYTQIAGIKYVNLPLLCAATRGITYEKSMRKTLFEDSRRIDTEFGSAEGYMKFIYKKMLFEEESSSMMSEFLKIVAEEDGGVLWFCNQGKDRTGIAAMLLEWLLGVDEETILKDYERSDKYLTNKHRLQRLGLAILPAKRHFKDVLYAMMEANPAYITDAMDELRKQYGTVEEYCRSRLHLTDEEISKIKTKYLE